MGWFGLKGIKTLDCSFSKKEYARRYKRVKDVLIFALYAQLSSAICRTSGQWAT